MKKFLWIAVLSISCKGPMSEIGHDSLITTSDEPPGVNCINGGTKIEIGVDKNNDGQLSSTEVTVTKYVCNGANGTNGANSLSELTDEPAGENCPNGGYKFEVGLDVNNNLILDASEVQSTKYICATKPVNDKLEELKITANLVSSLSTDYQLVAFPAQIIKFNKLNYSNVDSITFVVVMAGCHPPAHIEDCITPVVPFYAELFNVTDNLSVDNTQFHSTAAATWEFIESKNIYETLPGKDITLGIRVKTDSDANQGQVGAAYIFVYKH